MTQCSNNISTMFDIIPNQYLTSLLKLRMNLSVFLHQQEPITGRHQQEQVLRALVDSIPGVGHCEQMSQVIRFVDVDHLKKEVSVKEAFLRHIQIHMNDAAAIEKVIVENLDSDKLPVDECRSLCCNNAAVLSGHISGVQQRILERNPRALFVSCDNHNLNVARVHSASQEPLAVTFFGTIETVYLFFACSILRWEKLKQAVSITIKRESENRWSARVEAVKAINDGSRRCPRIRTNLQEPVGMRGSCFTTS